MKLIIGGTRGTHPISRPDFMKYGGDTTSFLVEGNAGERVLIDAGTGVHSLGKRLEQNHPSAQLLLLLTHFHLDHVMGLPSLSLIYKERWTVDVSSPVLQGFHVEEVMPRVFSKPFWPLQVEDLASYVRFKTLDDGPSSREPMLYGKLEIRWCPLHHPGGCTAYRIDEPATGQSMVIATDTEWSESSATEQSALIALAADASVLLMDGQFTADDYAQHKGWGHSTWKECCDVARRAGVAKLLITHHAPWRDDNTLDGVERQTRQYWPNAALARHGQVVDIASRSDTQQQ